MGYRDDNEALRQRLTQVEKELAEAKAQLTPHRALGPPSNPFLGGPLRLVFQEETQGELDDRGMERLVSHVRRELGESGRVDHLGRSLAWSTSHRSQTRSVEMICEIEDGRTIIRLQESFASLAGGLFGGVVGGVGGGGLGLVLPLMLIFGSPLMVPLAALGWIVGVYALVRRGYRRLTVRRAKQLGGLMNRLLDTAKREAGAAKPPHARAEAKEAHEEEVLAASGAKSEVD